MIRWCVLLVAVGTLSLLAAGPTGAVPAKRVAGHCSRSGDLCYGVFETSGLISLQIDTFARYFARYRLCVRPPQARETCRSFPIRRKGRLFNSTVRWERNYPDKGPGRYRVTWKLGSERLGPTLAFRLM